MRSYLAGLLLLLCTTAFSQAEINDQLKKILTDVLQDSALGSDLAKINGLPAKLNYTFQNEEKEEIVLNAQLLQKQYYRDDKTLSPAAVTNTGTCRKKHEKLQSHTSATRWYQTEHPGGPVFTKPALAPCILLFTRKEPGNRRKSAYNQG